jgi:hypothetical protein
MTAAIVIGAAAFIWIFIKLPQEWWIHIAQLDTTDLLRAHPWLGVLAAVALVGLVVLFRRVVLPRMPAPDYAWRIEADPIPAAVADPVRRDAWIARHRKVLDRRLLEKVALVGLVAVIFAQIVPGVTASNTEIIVGAAILITIDSMLGLWTARRSRGIASTARAFVWLALANAAVVAVAELLDRGEDEIPLGNTIFFVALLTLIVTLYDRYEPYHGVRFEPAG